MKDEDEKKKENNQLMQWVVAKPSRRNPFTTLPRQQKAKEDTEREEQEKQEHIQAHGPFRTHKEGNSLVIDNISSRIPNTNDSNPRNKPISFKTEYAVKTMRQQKEEEEALAQAQRNEVALRQEERKIHRLKKEIENLTFNTTTNQPKPTPRPWFSFARITVWFKSFFSQSDMVIVEEKQGNHSDKKIATDHKQVTAPSPKPSLWDNLLGCGCFSFEGEKRSITEKAPAFPSPTQYVL